MTILKWYSILIMMLGCIIGIYNSGKENNTSKLITVLILNIPIIVYLILS